jgi:hypothetical protein
MMIIASGKPLMAVVVNMGNGIVITILNAIQV